MSSQRSIAATQSPLSPTTLTSLAFAAGIVLGSTALCLANYLSFSTPQPSSPTPPPPRLSKCAILAVGSANADIFVVCDPKLPKSGETVGGSLRQIGPGGKGSNQAAAASKASINPSSVHLITSVGNDEHADMFRSAYRSINLSTSVLTVPDENEVVQPTGQAYILLEKGSSDNSIIVCPGANLQFPPHYHLFPEMFDQHMQLVATAEDILVQRQQQRSRSDQKRASNQPRLLENQCILAHIGLENRTALLNARVILLQREIPDSVNLLFAFAAQHINQFYNFQTDQCECCAGKSLKTQWGDIERRITVMLDVGGIGERIDLNILPYLDLLSFNETEMGRVYQQAFNSLPKQLQNSPDNPLLQFNHILDEESGAIHLPLLGGTNTTNACITLFQDYSMFSPSTNHSNTQTPNLATATVNYATTTADKQIPFQLDCILHASHAITALCQSHLSHTSTLPQFPTKSKSPLKFLLTLGTKGSLLLDQDRIYHYQAPIKLQTGEAVDSTGCGDSYRGSFATAYCDQLIAMGGKQQNAKNDADPSNASSPSISAAPANALQYGPIMRFATASATVCLGKLGTLPAMGTREQIEALLPRVPQM